MLAHHAFDVDPTRAATARSRLLADAIEPLADAYQADARRSLERLMARLVSHARTLPGARARGFDQRLSSWGLPDESALLARVERRRRQGPCTVARDAVRRVFVLSRVTVGADALLSSLALQKLARVFPHARIVFVGPPKNGALLAGEGAVEVLPLAYPQDGSLADAFFAWSAFADEVAKESGREGGETLVIDPDTRLLQSGLLPLAPTPLEARVGFSWDPTNDAGDAGTPGLARGFRTWLERTFGADETGEELVPTLSLSASDRDLGARVRAGLDTAGCRALVSVSFGIGENARKRVGAGECADAVSLFERDLLLGLLRMGADVVLDRGAGAAELRASRALLGALRGAGVEISSISATGAVPRRQPTQGRGRLVAFEGSVSAAAAIIGSSDLFIGYDSQGQHVAAAQSVDVVSVFAGYPHERFPDLWQPFGRGRCEVVRAGAVPISPPAAIALAAHVLRRPLVADLARRSPA